MKASPFTIRKSVTPKPQPVKKSPHITKPVPCTHANNGQTWCQTCANAYLKQARVLYTKALSESRRGEVIRAAQTILRKAILEYSLTPEGLNSLERQYVALVAQKRMLEAEKLREDIKKFRATSSKRNQMARKLSETKAARRTTIVSVQPKYTQPPTDANGAYMLSECPFYLSQHALERMEERLIRKEDIINTMKTPVQIVPAGEGLWKIIGANNVTTVGRFDIGNNDTKEFIIATVYTENKIR